MGQAIAVAANPGSPSQVLWLSTDGATHAVDLDGGSTTGFDPHVDLQLSPQVAHDLAVVSWTGGAAGYVFTGFGEIKEFGGATAVPDQSWVNKSADVWHAFAMDPAGNGHGAMLHKNGSVWFLSGTTGSNTVALSSGSVARGIAVCFTATASVPVGACYVLDYHGTVHAYNGAKGISNQFFRASDVARGLFVTDWETPTVYILTMDGLVRARGAGAVDPKQNRVLPGDVARDIAIPSTDPLTIIILDVYGHLYEVRESILPLVEFGAPTGTVTDTSRPKIIWGLTPIDHDPVDTIHIRLFSSAQSSPTTATPLWGVDVSPADIGEYPTQDLPDGTYYLYGWCTLTTGAVMTPASATFTVDLSRPATPTVAATAGTQSITVSVSGGVSGDTALVQSSDDGGTTWRTRRQEPYDGSGGYSFVDTEAAFGAARSYRAETVQLDPWLASDWSTVVTVTLSAGGGQTPGGVSAGVYLGDPVTSTDLSITVAELDIDDHINTGTFYPLGGELAVVITDKPTGREGTLKLWAQTAAEQTALAALLATGNPMWYRDAAGRVIHMARTTKLAWTWPVTIIGDTAYATVSFSWVEVAP